MVDQDISTSESATAGAVAQETIKKSNNSTNYKSEDFGPDLLEPSRTIRKEDLPDYELRLKNALWDLESDWNRTGQLTSPALSVTNVVMQRMALLQLMTTSAIAYKANKINHAEELVKVQKKLYGKADEELVECLEGDESDDEDEDGYGLEDDGDYEDDEGAGVLMGHRAFNWGLVGDDEERANKDVVVRIAEILGRL